MQQELTPQAHVSPQFNFEDAHPEPLPQKVVEPQTISLPPRLDLQRSLKDIKNFTLKAKVGEGAYGTVYRAEHTATKREYAIKVIQKSLVEKVCRKRLKCI